MIIGSWRSACIATPLLALAITGAACDRGPTAEAPPLLAGGGNFTLTDHNGRRFELSSLRGTAALMFFGFSSCPDLCPTTLSKLSSVYQRLGAEAKQIKTLFVTIDPERDTPVALKAYLAKFNLDVVGLTGTKEEIDKVVALYDGVYDIAPTSSAAESYTVSHTTTVYVLDADGRLRLRFRYDASVDQIAQGIRSVIPNLLTRLASPSQTQ